MRRVDSTLSGMLSAVRLTPAEAFKRTPVVVQWLHKIAADSGLTDSELAEKMYPWRKDRMPRRLAFMESPDPQWEDVRRFLNATGTLTGRLLRLAWGYPGPTTGS